MTGPVDADVQAAVDATSIMNDYGERDLVDILREQLAERGIDDPDEDWLTTTVEKIRADRNLMVDDDPRD